MRIGIFSGTFDPVHDGHVALAIDALERASLDRLIFLPEASPRRKNNIIPLGQRVDMLKLVASENEKLEVFTCQNETHSVDETMTELHRKYGKENQYFLVMGADVFEHIEGWSSHAQLAIDNSFILGLRTEDDGELAIEIAVRLGLEPTMIISALPSLSSSEIRRALKKRAKANGLNSAVQQYIRSNKLYGNTKVHQREKLYSLRRKLSSGEVERRSQDICNKLFDSVAWSLNPKIHVYLPIARNNEISTWPLLSRLWRSKTDVKIFTSMYGGNKALQHVRINQSTQYRTDDLGIPMPASNYTQEAGEYSLIIVPTLGFDKNRNRLGYGRGVYDSFLAQHKNARKVGLAYENSKQNQIETESHDMPLDAVVTEENFY